MIHNDQELQATQERIAYFQRLPAQLRVTATPAEFPLVASGDRAEVVRMQDEVLAECEQQSRDCDGDSGGSRGDRRPGASRRRAECYVR
jgi:hypothetical protein